MRRRLAVLVLAAVAACGGGGKRGPDARNDAGAFADAPFAGTCDYTEHADGTNSTTAEPTGLTVGGTAVTICGQVDPGHFANTTIDDDTYQITIGGTGADLVVRLTGQGAADLGEMFVQIQDTQGSYGYGVFVVDHGVMITHLAAGTYVVLVEARDAADIATPIPYRVAIAGDLPAMRCPRVTAAASHAEADESASAFTKNDVVYITSAGNESLTPSTADAPDDSKVVVTSGKAYRLTGSSANVDVAPPNGDDYHDRDTFLISTGADTNELDVRLDWVGATNDLDFFLFPEDTAGTPPLDIGAAATSHPEELQAIAVAPSSRYWLWVGGYDMSKALPSAYDVSVCGEHHTP